MVCAKVNIPGFALKYLPYVFLIKNVFGIIYGDVVYLHSTFASGTGRFRIYVAR